MKPLRYSTGPFKLNKPRMPYISYPLTTDASGALACCCSIVVAMKAWGLACTS